MTHGNPHIDALYIRHSDQSAQQAVFGVSRGSLQIEMPRFPGAILFTTNCIQKPAESYISNVFTTGLVGWPGVAHVKNGFRFVIGYIHYVNELYLINNIKHFNF